MHAQQLLIDLVEQFCTYQHKQRGETEGGVTTYRWHLDRFLTFVRSTKGARPASAISHPRRYKHGWTTWQGLT
jgi:hypothetical protein